jgi:hypothetical protein
MAYCTIVEWDEGFDLARYAAMAQRPGDDELPAGCLSRVVGDRRVVEVWRSAEDAQRFGEQSAGLLAEQELPAPARVEGFEAAVFQTRRG